MSLIDRVRAEALMRSAGLDAVIAFQPESVAYIAGAHPGVAAHFRRAGAASALLPCDPGLSRAAVMPDLAEGAVRRSAGVSDVRYHPIWVDVAVAAGDRDAPLPKALRFRAHATARPSTFDARTAFGLLSDQLRERGLDRARLGVDLSFLPVADFNLLQASLPHATLADGSDIIAHLKMIKTPHEIDLLRTAVHLSEVGLAAAEVIIAPGVEPAALSESYNLAVRAAARVRGAALTGLWDYISVGPEPWGMGKPIGEGDIIKFDIGAVVAGYSSDMARTWVYGEPPRAAGELHAALLSGLEAGLEMLGPGVALRDVHAKMLGVIRAAGVEGYARGHFGHSLGHGVFSEEWPFIAADSNVLAEPGMVLAVEAPLYVDGLGGFIIEEQVLVAETGIEIMSSGDRSFRRFG